MKVRLGRIDLSLVFGLFLLLLVGGGILVAYLLSRPPDPYADAANDLPAAIAAYRAAGFPWEAKDFDPNPPAEADNAATYIYQAINLEGPVMVRFRQTPKLQKLANAEKYSAMLPLFASEEKVLDLGRRAAKCPRLAFQRDWDLGLKMLVTDGSDVRSVARLLCLRAIAVAATGDVASSVADLASAMRLAHLLQQDPVVVSQLMACTIAQTAVSDYGIVAYEFRKDPVALKQLIAELDQGMFTPNLLGGFGEAYQGISFSRNAALYGGLKAVDRRLRVTEDYTIYMGWTDEVKLDPAKLVRSGYPESEADRANLDLYLRTWLSVKEILKSGRHPPAVASQMADAMIESSKSPATPLNILSRAVFQSDFAALYIDAQRLEAWTAITKAFLRAAEMKARTGRYPTSMSEIPGKWIDPYSQKPVRIRADKNTFRVYSVGPDLKDDGGYSYHELSAMKKQGSDMIQSIPPAH